MLRARRPASSPPEPAASLEEVPVSLNAASHSATASSGSALNEQSMSAQVWQASERSPESNVWGNCVAMPRLLRGSAFALLLAAVAVSGWATFSPCSVLQVGVTPNGTEVITYGVVRRLSQSRFGRGLCRRVRRFFCSLPRPISNTLNLRCISLILSSAPLSWH